MYRILQGTSPEFETMVEFLHTWPDLSPEWLLLGEGTMEHRPADVLPVPKGRGASSLPSPSLQALTVTLGNDGKQHTELGPVHAQAGYSRQHNEAVFLEQLRPYRIPGFDQATYRAFEVAEDSMRPTINHADVVVASFVDNWRVLEPGAVYVVVTWESVMLKRIGQRITDMARGLELLSDNPDAWPPTG